MKENHDLQQVNLFDTSKHPDRIHKSTVAVEIRAENMSILQPATPKVMRGTIYTFIYFLYPPSRKDKG